MAKFISFICMRSEFYLLCAIPYFSALSECMDSGYSLAGWIIKWQESGRKKKKIIFKALNKK